MSSATINQFFQDIAQDTTLLQQLQEATERESLVNKMVELGKEKGYSFTPNEADEWLTSAAAQFHSQSDGTSQLSDDELEAVSGGGILGAIFGGIGGVIGGTIAAIASGQPGEIGNKAKEAGIIGFTTGLITPGL